MDNSKIKNIIIAILLFVNVFLLANVIMDKFEQGASGKAAIAAAERVLENNGIILAEGVDLGIDSPAKCTVLRDTEKEDDIIKALIGRHGKNDVGGNIIYYSSEDGQANLRGTGQTDAIFSNGYITIKGSKLKTVQKLTDKIGLEVMNAAEGDKDTVSVQCTWNGRCVYNANLTFTFSGSSLVMMSGVRVFDRLSSQSDESTMDCLTALMRFIEITNEKGYICSELRDISAGYLMNVEVSGESVLTPVWHIVTDTVEVYINALTGKEESLI